jgi:hypothetical protein
LRHKNTGNRDMAADTPDSPASAGSNKIPSSQGKRLGQWLLNRWLDRSPGAGRNESVTILPSDAAPGVQRSRSGESDRVWFRTERIFFQNGRWYIATREGIDVGPFADARTARREARHLVKLLAEARKHGEQDAGLTIQQFIHRPILVDRR